MSKKDLNVQNPRSILEKNKKILDIYLNFKSKLHKTIKSKPFVVAVSGGPDSLALTALSHIYKQDKKNKVFFVLVDHRIRKNSSKEATSVRKLLKIKKINLNILKNKKKINKNIQNQARTVRYKMLLDFCKKKGIKFLLTGHHSDDQIETFFIRLSRGSGVQGLSSMDQITKLEHNIKLFRPFLECKKKDLIYVAKRVFGKIFKDPSNNNKRYLRIKIRHLKSELEKSGIHHDQILKSINNLASTRDTVNDYLKRVISECTRNEKNKKLVNLKRLHLESNEIKIKLLSLLIKNFSKSYYPPRSKKVLNVLKGLELKRINKFTLGGCLLERSGDYLSITKEI